MVKKNRKIEFGWGRLGVGILGFDQKSWTFDLDKKTPSLSEL
jgi:hypothetical protein